MLQPKKYQKMRKAFIEHDQAKAKKRAEEALEQYDSSESEEEYKTYIFDPIDCYPQGLIPCASVKPKQHPKVIVEDEKTKKNTLDRASKLVGQLDKKSVPDDGIYFSRSSLVVNIVKAIDVELATIEKKTDDQTVRCDKRMAVACNVVSERLKSVVPAGDDIQWNAGDSAAMIKKTQSQNDAEKAKCSKEVMHSLDSIEELLQKFVHANEEEDDVVIIGEYHGLEQRIRNRRELTIDEQRKLWDDELMRRYALDKEEELRRVVEGLSIYFQKKLGLMKTWCANPHHKNSEILQQRKQMEQAACSKSDDSKKKKADTKEKEADREEEEIDYNQPCTSSAASTSAGSSCK